jgi:hypothetical protein
MCIDQFHYNCVHLFVLLLYVCGCMETFRIPTFVRNIQPDYPNRILMVLIHCGSVTFSKLMINRTACITKTNQWKWTLDVSPRVRCKVHELSSFCSVQYNNAVSLLFIVSGRQEFERFPSTVANTV